MKNKSFKNYKKTSTLDKSTFFLVDEQGTVVSKSKNESDIDNFIKYNSNKIILIYSGGLDSTTVLFDLLDRGYNVIPMIVDYGQKHGKDELQSAHYFADVYCKDKIILDLSQVDIFKESGLVNKDIEIKDGLYSKENIETTVVGNRNSLLANYGLAYAMKEQAIGIALGIHSEDSETGEIEYPDCSPEFVNSLKELAKQIDFREYEVLVPFSGKSKVDVVKRGLELKVPYQKTWSCYRGKSENGLACGRCGTCIQRFSAFKKNNSEDPIQYETIPDLDL